MIEHMLDRVNAVLYVRPTSALDETDFAELAGSVDPFIEQSGDLAGLVIEAPSFPGWDSFGAMAAHFRFLRDHQKRVKRIALVTDSVLGDVAEHLASHFVSAEIRHFGAGDIESATAWVNNAG
jgi:hypothetical protein